MEAGWGRWYRLERAGLINKKRWKLGQRWGRRQVVCWKTKTFPRPEWRAEVWVTKRQVGRKRA